MMMLDDEDLRRGVARYGGLGQAVVAGRVINADTACEECMSAAMRKCGDKPRDQAEAIAISECKEKCPTQPKNDDDSGADESVETSQPAVPMA